MGVIGEVVEDNSGCSNARLRWTLPLTMNVDVTIEADQHGGTYTFPVSLNSGPDQKSTLERLKIARCIISNKVSNYLYHPDHLNLMGPYFLGCSSIVVVTVNLFWPECFSNMMAASR